MMPAAATNDERTAPDTDVIVESEQWSAYPEAEATVLNAIQAAASFEGRPGELAVVLTDDATIRALNAQWRRIDKPTNVLSFPAGTLTASQAAHLGDIVIACETVAREAAAENKAFLDHLAHLAIHGYLHLIGFDHETDAEAGRMESLETQILSSLSIADPYTDRTFAD